MSLCPPQIPHGPPWVRTQASAVTSQGINFIYKTTDYALT